MNRTSRLFIKWTARLSLLAAMLSFAFYWSAWRSGIIKYACGQTVSESMRAHYAFMASPLLTFAIHGAFLLSSLCVAWIFAELRFGVRAGDEIKDALRTMSKKWLITAPLLLSWFYLIFIYNPYAFRSGASWILFGITLVITVLFWKADFTAEPKLLDENLSPEH